MYFIRWDEDTWIKQNEEGTFDVLFKWMNADKVWMLDEHKKIEAENEEEAMDIVIEEDDREIKIFNGIDGLRTYMKKEYDITLD